MIGESVVVIGSSLYVFCSFFDLKQCAGYVLFHAVCEYICSGDCGVNLFCSLEKQISEIYTRLFFPVFLIACIPSVKWSVGIKKWFYLR